jgi:tetratricopeptide (TPR) repeat protein
MGGGNSGWYFYNPSAVGFGQVEFTKLWGRRKLEDNWRRRNKTNLGVEDSDVVEGDIGGYEDINLGTSKKAGLSDKSQEYYIEDLPLTDSLVELSNYRMVQAYFNIGKVYKEEFKDYGKSIVGFQTLIDRFPENDKMLFTYYNLYQIYKENLQVSDEEKYKNLIISEFPDSRSAKIVSNPNYFVEVEEQRKLVTDFYTETYQLYATGNYEMVINNCSNVDSTFERNHLRARFIFLKIISMGESGQYDLAVIRNELIGLIASYPESEVVDSAQILLNFIRTGLPEMDPSGEIISGGEELVENQEPEPEIYEFDEIATHYYILLVANKNLNINEIKFKITDFNTSFYSTEFHGVESILLDDIYHMIYIKNLQGSEKALNYFKAINENGMVFDDLEETDYRQFVISLENYRTFYQDKDVLKYLKFYKKFYQNN